MQQVISDLIVCSLPFQIPTSSLKMTSAKVLDNIYPVTTFLSDLPSKVVPQSLQSSLNGPSGRLIIIGDVHGMRKSLEALLDKICFDKAKGDHLILVGDLVNKGPDSPGVVDLAMKLGASAVRGNHENAVLNAVVEIDTMRKDQLGHKRSTGQSAVPGDPKFDSPGDGVEVPETPVKDAPDTTSVKMRASPTTQSTAMSLSKHQLDWLAALPLILRIKLPENLTSPLGDTLIIVHAGLVPGIPLEEQDPHAVMHIRSLNRREGNEDGFIPTEIFEEEGWVVEWDRWQDTLESKTTVIFGHDAKRRLQLGKYTIGLDSSCLYGNQLSAIVIGARERRIFHEIVQVECADAPVVPTVSVKESETDTGASTKT
jgi:hypothetical protein